MKDNINLSLPLEEILNITPFKTTSADDYAIIPQPRYPSKTAEGKLSAEEYVLHANPKTFDVNDIQILEHTLNNYFYKMEKLYSNAAFYWRVSRLSDFEIITTVMKSVPVSESCYSITTDPEISPLMVVFKAQKDLKTALDSLLNYSYLAVEHGEGNFITVSFKTPISKTPISVDEALEYASNFGDVKCEVIGFTISSTNHKALTKVAKNLSEHGVYVTSNGDSLSVCSVETALKKDTPSSDEEMNELADEKEIAI